LVAVGAFLKVQAGHLSGSSINSVPHVLQVTELRGFRTVQDLHALFSSKPTTKAVPHAEQTVAFASFSRVQAWQTIFLPSIFSLSIASSGISYFFSSTKGSVLEGATRSVNS
jgi:hypothetical protein